jgi:Ca-activated chloride channel family protein
MTNTEPQVLITPLKPALIQGMAQKLPVLIRVQAPDPDPARKVERKPYHLSLVIDRSGSMSGEPLIEAVRCAKYIVDQLAPTDLASVVAFDNNVRILAETATVGDRKHLHRALSQIRPGGNTNLHGGWKAGMDSLLAKSSEAALARVILLSDGNANEGETTETDVIASFCADAATKGVTTSTYGLGRDFNEQLMVEMGKRGAGNHYYGDTAADLFEPFAEEFDLIANLYARHIRLSIAAPEGVKITLINDYPAEERNGFPLIRLPDIPWGAEAWALVELEIPAGLALESGNQLLQAAISASTVDGAPISFQDAALALKALSPQAWEALLDDPLVRSRLTELEAGKFLDQARAAAEYGDWNAIQKMIAEAQKRFADHPWVMEVLSEMADLAKAMDGARFRKEALYSSGKMSRRLSAKEEMLANLASESSSASYLRRKKAQGKSQFQAGTDSTS